MKLLSPFFFFLCFIHFILMEQSLPAGHSPPGHAFSLKFCRISFSKAALYLAPDDEKWKCFPWTLSAATFVRPSPTCGYSLPVNAPLCCIPKLLFPVCQPWCQTATLPPPTLWYNFPRGNKILPFSFLPIKPLPRMSSAVKAAAKDLISGGCRSSRPGWFRYENIPSAPPSVNLLTTWSYFRGRIFPASRLRVDRYFCQACWLGWGTELPSVWFWVRYFLNHAYRKFQLLAWLSAS